MFYCLREDVKIQKSLNDYYLSFIGEHLESKQKMKCIVKINDSGYEILSLCNGLYTEIDILNILMEKYPNEDLESMVREFLKPLIQDGIILIKYNLNQTDTSNILGSNEYYCPSTIMLELTNYCPLNCIHCYLGDKENKYIDKSKLEIILQNIVDLGVHYVQLTGGEVLTYPFLKFAIEFLVKHHIQVNISTSGLIYNDEIMEILSNINLTGGFIRVSLDGLKKTHNELRRNTNSFNNALIFLKKAIDMGIETQVATVVVNQDRDEIYKLTELVKSIGVKQQIFERVYLQGNAKKISLRPSYTHQEYLDLIFNLSNEYSNDVFTITTEDINKNNNCGAGYKTYKIAYNLDVTPCIIMNYSLGNIDKEGLIDIIRNNYHKYLELKSPCRDLCGSCVMIDNCEGCYAKMLQYKNQVQTCRWYNQQDTFILGVDVI